MVVIIAEKTPPGRRAVFNIPEWLGRWLIRLARRKELPKHG